MPQRKKILVKHKSKIVKYETLDAYAQNAKLTDTKSKYLSTPKSVLVIGNSKSVPNTDPSKAEATPIKTIKIDLRKAQSPKSEGNSENKNADGERNSPKRRSWVVTNQEADEVQFKGRSAKKSSTFMPNRME
mmetsp:Transcript_17729/g.15532  ORF Transcript_17729/g.15532 Transcript_17729/m.15532 type:complete len:132 (+) Transcript_17729:148-543(+)|eukprot:CAMPEP_0114582726 /NCGR_PEP_ID=MMETSP0125-20121206/6630_1 /TAXON_ID=485358 ORGANISM="Aristerostoma sp., Strain ATCC 50986" /NCGR_SAMPLE_ID=MMETSP0125 /ASSEMBLY_ACC=CAM_ASM_000245 /LENGTH=131 /DNA_ID=CAMNT_0001775813 /DNA_START=124 /DNA_END=519 /DNA_ORIENTATION=+